MCYKHMPLKLLTNSVFQISLDYSLFKKTVINILLNFHKGIFFQKLFSVIYFLTHALNRKFKKYPQNVRWALLLLFFFNNSNSNAIIVSKKILIFHRNLI